MSSHTDKIDANVNTGFSLKTNLQYELQRVVEERTKNEHAGRTINYKTDGPAVNSYILAWTVDYLIDLWECR